MKSLLIVAVLAAPAFAQPAEISEDDAVALYREKSPRVAATTAGIDVVAADRVGAQIYPNPSLHVGGGTTVQGDTANASHQVSLGLEVPLLIGRQRGARVDAADLGITHKKAEVARDVLAGELDVRRKFVALLAAQDRVKSLSTAVTEARAVRELAAGRAKAGAKSNYDVERTDLALATRESELADAGAVLESASGDLAIAVGVGGWHPRAAGALATAAPLVATAAHPDLEVLRLEELRAHADERVAHAEAVPTPTIEVSGFRTFDPVGVGIGLDVAIPLPFTDRNQGAVAKARAEVRAARLAIDARKLELDVGLDATRRTLAVREATLAKFSADAIERLPRLQTMAQNAYREGQGGIVELIDALDAISAARLRQIELLEGVANARIDVRAVAAGR